MNVPIHRFQVQASYNSIVSFPKSLLGIQGSDTNDNKKNPKSEHSSVENTANFTSQAHTNHTNIEHYKPPRNST